jgi:hypothetical protein
VQRVAGDPEQHGGVVRDGIAERGSADLLAG